MGGIPTRCVIAPTSDAYKLPELKTTILAGLTFSHVCKRWHKIVLNRPAMWQCVRISYRQLSGLGNISRDITACSHVYRLHLDMSLLGCKWHSSQDVSKAARHLLDENILRCESLRVEGPRWALDNFVLIAPHLICLNAQFAGASQFPPDMDRIIFEGHLFSRQIHWDAFSISGAKPIVLSNVGIPFPYHLGILPAHLPGHVCAKAKYLARTG